MKNIRLSKKAQKLLDEFDEAARDWGWTSDQGTGRRVADSQELYNDTKKDLTKYISNLELRIRLAKTMVINLKERLTHETTEERTSVEDNRT